MDSRTAPAHPHTPEDETTLDARNILTIYAPGFADFTDEQRRAIHVEANRVVGIMVRRAKRIADEAKQFERAFGPEATEAALTLYEAITDPTLLDRGLATEGELR